MNVEDTLARARTDLQRLGSEKGRQSALQFFKEPVDPYGVYAPDLKKLSQSYGREIKPWPLAQRNKLCTALFKSGMLEEGSLAVYLYTRFARQCAACEFQLFERWIDRHVHNWAHCDGVCANLISACIANEPELIARLPPWTASSNRWKRRAAPVSMVKEARKGRHTAEIFDIAGHLMEDADEMVQKGTGWLLKETYPPRPKETVRFLQQWQDRTSRLLLRYAAEKMTPADRAKFGLRSPKQNS